MATVGFFRIANFYGQNWFFVLHFKQEKLVCCIKFLVLSVHDAVALWTLINYVGCSSSIKRSICVAIA